MCANLKRILYLGLDPARYQTNGTVTHWPIIQINPRPLNDPHLQLALQQFVKYTHVIITSKSTVAILMDYLPQSGISNATWSAKITLAVGNATAEYLQACGIQPARIAKEETAEGLIDEIDQMDLKTAHFFWPHSSQARPVIEQFFAAHSIQYTSCILYDPKLRIPGALPKLENYDEIIFTSPSTIDAFLEVFGQFPSNNCLTPIGPITAAYLEIKKSQRKNLIH